MNKKKTSTEKKRIITSDLILSDSICTVAVMGLYPGAGASTIVAYLTRQTQMRMPPPLIFDRGILPASQDELAAKLAFSPLQEPDEAAKPSLVDLVVLLGHAKDRPQALLPIYAQIDAIYKKAGKPRPQIIYRHKGMGDHTDKVLASKTELSEWLLWLMAQAFLPANSPDLEMARQLFGGDRFGEGLGRFNKGLGESNKPDPNKL